MIEDLATRFLLERCDQPVGHCRVSGDNYDKWDSFLQMVKQLGNGPARGGMEQVTGEEGISLFAIPSASPGLERRLLPTMDQTRKQAELTLQDVRLPASALMGEEGEGWAGDG